MKTKRAVKLIKRLERKPRQRRGTVQIAAGPTSWSTEVRSWVVDFQARESESLPAFETLFKDAESQTNTTGE
jgi:hypothetical protein